MTKDLPERRLQIRLEDIGKPVTVLAGYRNVIQIMRPTVRVDIIEAEDTLFRYDSVVFLPDGIPDKEAQINNAYISEQTRVGGLAVLKGFFNYSQLCQSGGRPKKVLITGHTDTVGSNAYNEKLSKKRADVILSLILGGKEARDKFVEHVNEKNTPEDQQQILKWISQRVYSSLTEEERNTIRTIPQWTEVDPGDIDGKIGPNTKDAIRAFKMLFKKQFPPPGLYETLEFSPDLQDIKDGLKTGPQIGKYSWAAIFEIYQAELQLAMKKSGHDLASIRENLQWVDEEMKSVGCGETWPLENRGQDNYRSQTNRRVEILFYDPEELKEELPCKDGTCDQQDCHIFKNLDRYENEKNKGLKPKLGWVYLPIDADGNLIQNKLRVFLWSY